MGVRPSSFLGLEWDSYEAYCLDEAVTYFGTKLEAELDSVGEDKPSAEERRDRAARQRILDRVFGEGEKSKGSGFADPALMFGN